MEVIVYVEGVNNVNNGSVLSAYQQTLKPNEHTIMKILMKQVEDSSVIGGWKFWGTFTLCEYSLFYSTSYSITFQEEMIQVLLLYIYLTAIKSYFEH